MSLEWARARLLQHREALRRLRDAQAAARATLRPNPLPRPPADLRESGIVLAFGPPGRRRRA